MSGGKILIVDDDEAIRIVISEALRRDGHEVAVAGSVAEQAALIEAFAPDVLITDVILPDGNGLDMVPGILAKRPDLPVIVLSAQNTLSTAVRATEQGAFEYLPKPFDLDELSRAVRDGLRRKVSSAGLAGTDSDEGDIPLIGRSPAMQQVYRTIARVVPNDLSVLILGESGTGKELVARAIHDMGNRKSRPFVAINMAAIPRDLIEADLFGHERGAFTGAQGRTAGKFEQAAGGTLFLDEIGDMPMEAQTRLLRVLQSGEFTTVGGSRPIRANVRIIAATHKNLPELIAENAFREDLYYRLNVVPIDLPPLRDRGHDIALLASHFLDKAANEGLPRKRLGEDAAKRLVAHSWPGNVRELENLMRRLAVLGRNDQISSSQVAEHIASLAEPVAADSQTPDHPDFERSLEDQFRRLLEDTGQGAIRPGLYNRMVATLERPMLRAVMTSARGNQIKAASILGINRNTLRKKLSDLEIDPSWGRSNRA
jgi:two-component system, NtrC family, nitrogen regulation response regulator GlnG